MTRLDFEAKHAIAQISQITCTGHWMQEPKSPTTSSSYLLPVEDGPFLLRDEMRGIRFALEYAKAELALRD